MHFRSQDGVLPHHTRRLGALVRRQAAQERLPRRHQAVTIRPQRTKDAATAALAVVAAALAVAAALIAVAAARREAGKARARLGGSRSVGQEGEQIGAREGRAQVPIPPLDDFVPPVVEQVAPATPQERGRGARGASVGLGRG